MSTVFVVFFHELHQQVGWARWSPRPTWRSVRPSEARSCRLCPRFPAVRCKEEGAIAVLNALAACASVAGGLDAIAQVIRVCVFVNSAPGFTEQPTVANGASDLPV